MLKMNKHRAVFGYNKDRRSFENGDDTDEEMLEMICDSTQEHLKTQYSNAISVEDLQKLKIAV